MKKYSFVILVGLMALLLTACGQADGVSKEQKASGDSNEQKKDEIVIGASMLNMGNEFIVQLKEGMEAKAGELGVKIIFTDAETNASTQVQQVENFIVQEVDAIILNPVETDASSPAVVKAQEAGIPIINVNSVTSTQPDAFVGSRDEDSAEIAINFIAEKLSKKGNIVMMRGNPGQSAEVKRGQGALDTLKNYPDMELIAEQTAKWSRDQSLTLMQNWLQTYQGEIDGVFAQNDEMAMGALKALEDAGVSDDIILVGIDAIADALQAVKDGRLDATVYQSATGQGGGAVETAVKIIKGESYEKEVMIPFELVTPDNVDEYLK